MLVLARRTDEKIIVRTPTDKIEIMLVSALGRNEAKIGVKAPSHMVIDREEIDYKRQRGIR